MPALLPLQQLGELLLDTGPREVLGLDQLLDTGLDLLDLDPQELDPEGEQPLELPQPPPVTDLRVVKALRHIKRKTSAVSARLDPLDPQGNPAHPDRTVKTESRVKTECQAKTPQLTSPNRDPAFAIALQDLRGHPDPLETKDPRDIQESKENPELQESPDQRDQQANKDPKARLACQEDLETKERLENTYQESPRQDPQEDRERWDLQGLQDPREPREKPVSRDRRVPQEIKETRDPTANQDSPALLDPRVMEELMERATTVPSPELPRDINYFAVFESNSRRLLLLMGVSYSLLVSLLPSRKIIQKSVLF